MNSKKIVLVALMISVLGIGCGPTEVVAEPITVTYVVNTADVPEPDAMDRLPGFDLDSANGTAATDRCDDALDFTSPITSAGGVDNQLGANVIGLLASMLPAGVAGSIEEQIAAGTFLLLMEVSDINSFNNDSSVNVTLFLGALPAGTTMAMVGGDGRLTAGQTFTSMTTLATVTGAAIVGGRLTVAADSLPLSLTVSGTAVTLTATNRVFDQTANWTFSYSNAAVVAEGTYGGTAAKQGQVTYTASLP